MDGVIIETFSIYKLGNGGEHWLKASLLVIILAHTEADYFLLEILICGYIYFWKQYELVYCICLWL